MNQFHAPLEAKALSNGNLILNSQMEYGIAPQTDIQPEEFHPSLRPQAAFIRKAIEAGARGMGGVLTYATQECEADDVQDAMRHDIVTISEYPEVHPGDLVKSAHIVREYSAALTRYHLLCRLTAAEDLEAQDAILEEIATLKESVSNDSLSSKIAARSFDSLAQPEKPTPILQLIGKPLCTRGNIMNVQAPAKAGKSAVIESMISAIFNGNRQGPDTLSFVSENPLGHAVVHIDTEQSRYDHDSLVRKALRRAGITTPPPWFKSVSMADLSIQERKGGLLSIITKAAKEHGGIFAVFIDGVADLVLDPNDSEESFSMIGVLHAIAIRRNCAIITVLHENPSSDANGQGKTRGHLGSQLERKAECNLRLAKAVDGITTIWAERARHCHLPKNEGPCFTWNDELRMHTSCGTAGEIKSAAKREKQISDALKSFSGKDSMRHTDLVAATMEALNILERAAKTRIKDWLNEGIATKNQAGNYILSDV